MDDRTKLTLFRGIKSGAFNDRQKLEAFRAIKGNVENNDVADLIGSLSFSTLRKGKSLKEMSDDRQGRDTSNFDYTTGADGTLRSLLSFAETDGDREAILKKMVGEAGFVRDAGGNLALTQEGQKARGMEPMGKNLVIDETGFSMRDISDLAGIVPETVGAVAGAIIGGGPTFGLGAVTGAGIGAGLGQAAEEVIEGWLGVQTQSLGEVTKDVLKEAAIGAAGEAVAGTIIAIGRGVVGGSKKLAGRASGSMAEEPIDAAARLRLERGENLLERGYIPSLGSLGANERLAYLQKFGENASKDTTRIQANLAAALREREAFLSGISGDAVDTLGSEATKMAPIRFDELNAAKQKADKLYISALDDSINLMRRAVDGDFELNTSTLGAITKAFDGFQNSMIDGYGSVDDILGKIKGKITLSDGTQASRTGGQLRIFDTKNLMSKFKEYEENFGRTLLEGPVGTAFDALKGFQKNQQGKASFQNLVNLRKNVNDELMFGSSTAGTKQLDEIKGALDTMLNDKTILDGVTGLNKTDKLLLQQAAKRRLTQQNMYKDGIKRFEELSNIGVIKSINGLKAFGDASPREISDKFFKKIVQNDSPQRLTAVLKATDNPDELLSNLSRSFLDDALETAGRDPINPEKFNGKKFAKKIKDLKTTGKVLFGEDWNKIQRLANSINQADIMGKLSMDDIARVRAAGGDKNIVEAMEDVLQAQKQIDIAGSTSVIKNLDPSKVSKYSSYDDVVAALTKPSLTESETIQIMKFFDGNDQLIQSMRNVVLQDIMKVVDDTVLESAQNAGSLRKTLDGYKPRSLSRILGDDTYKALDSFADDLVMLGDAGKEGAIAAGSIWSQMFSHPLNVIGRIGKFKVMATMFSKPQNVKKYIDMRKAAANNPEARGNVMLAMMNQAAIDEGIDVGEKAALAGRIASGVGSATGQVSRAGLQSQPRIAFNEEGPFRQKSRTSIPNVQPISTNLDYINIPEVRKQPTTSAPLSPIERIQQEAVRKMSLRERARQSPAAAATLLGGLGSADLL